MEYILIILSSFLFTIPLYLPELFFLSWFALIPLIYLTRDYDYSHSFVSALFVGILNSIFSFYWLYKPLAANLTMPSSFILFLLFIYVIISALFIPFWLTINKFLQPQKSFSPIIAALSWSGLEFLRFEYFNINPFNYLAYTQSAFASITQYASFGGMFLISFITILIAGYLVKIFIKPSFKRSVPLILLILLIIFLPMIFNSNLKENYNYQKLSILVNNSVEKGSSFEQLDQEIDILAELINKSESSYIFTSEKSLNFDLLRNNYYREKLFKEIGERKAGTYLQLGSVAAEAENYDSQIKDSLFLVDSEYKLVNRYNKEKSIITAVNLPYKKKIFDYINNYIKFDSKIFYSPVESVKVNNLSYLNLIADEIFIPLILNKNEKADKEFNLIINSAAEERINSKVYNNLSWSAAVIRAAESRKSLLRISRGGYSGYINPKSNLVLKKRIKNSIEELNVALIERTSYYHKNPRKIPYLILIFNAIIISIKLILVIRKKLSSRN